jgi:hypothetical protein
MSGKFYATFFGSRGQRWATNVRCFEDGGHAEYATDDPAKRKAFHPDWAPFFAGLGYTLIPADDPEPALAEAVEAVAEESIDQPSFECGIEDRGKWLLFMPDWSKGTTEVDEAADLVRFRGPLRCMFVPPPNSPPPAPAPIVVTPEVAAAVLIHINEALRQLAGNDRYTITFRGACADLFNVLQPAAVRLSTGDYNP